MKGEHLSEMSEQLIFQPIFFDDRHRLRKPIDTNR